MSSPDLDDTPSIQQALTEESIFLLIKRLSRCLKNTSDRKKGNSRISDCKSDLRHHFQVYEKLLQNSHSISDYGMYDNVN